MPDYQIDVKVCVSKCKMHLRFPIPDLRPLHDMGRVPWWRKSVRPDYVTLHWTDAKIHTSYKSKSAYSIKHEIQCQNLLVTYTEADSDIPMVDDPLENTPKHQPTLFSSKQVIHESDTPHSRLSNGGGKENLDQK